jgi:hypothetical protein
MLLHNCMVRGYQNGGHLVQEFRIKNLMDWIQESGSVPIRVAFFLIRGSGPGPDPFFVCICNFEALLTGLDPRIETRFRVSFDSFNKIP